MKFAPHTLVAVAFILAAFSAKAQQSIPTPASSVGGSGQAIVAITMPVVPAYATCANGLITTNLSSVGCLDPNQGICGLSKTRVFYTPQGKLSGIQGSVIQQCMGKDIAITQSFTPPTGAPQFYVEVPNVSGFYTLYFWPECPLKTKGITLNSSRNYENRISGKAAPVHTGSTPEAGDEEVVTFTFACLYT